MEQDVAQWSGSENLYETFFGGNEGVHKPIVTCGSTTKSSLSVKKNFI